MNVEGRVRYSLISYQNVALGLMLGAISFYVSLSGILIFQYFVVLALLIASANTKIFYVYVVPILVCFSCYEANIFYVVGERGYSLHSISPVGSLWPLSFAVYIIANVDWGKKSFNEKYVLLYLFLLVSFVFSSWYFVNTYDGLGFINKEPIKQLLYMAVAMFFIKDFLKLNVGKAQVILFSTVVIAVAVTAHKLLSWNYFVLKDVGGYNYLTIPFAIYFAGISSKRKDNALFVFAIILYILSFKASRTEIFLYFLFVPFFIIYSKNYLAAAIVFISLVVFFMVADVVDSNMYTYFIHKMNFYVDIFESGVADIGMSASVRLYEFYNLIDGFGTDFVTLLFGRGIYGFISFDNYFNYAIYSDGAFSLAEHSKSKYFRLHFVLNEVLFYFGIVGAVVIYFILKSSFTERSWLIVPFLSYLSLNFMFRGELMVLIPIYSTVLSIAFLEKSNR